MHRLNIGETILRLRRQRNITQEQLAGMVGVSAGAVSKWETGNSTPDIALLAPLARVLNTSLDQLLSFQQDLTEAEVSTIKQKLTGIFLHQGFTAGETECQNYLKEYPNCVGLKFEIASLIQVHSMMSDTGSEDFLREKRQLCLNLFQQVAQSSEQKYIPSALFCIAFIHMELENYEESEKTLAELPQDQITPAALYPTLYMKMGKSQEAHSFCSKMLFQYINFSLPLLTTLVKIAKNDKNYDKAFYYLDTCYQLENLFGVGLHSAAYNYCKLFIETGKNEEAAQWFGTYAEGLLKTGYDYKDNPYFENINLEVNPEGQKIVRKKLYQSLIDDEELTVLAGIPDYENAISKLKIAATEI